MILVHGEKLVEQVMCKVLWFMYDRKCRYTTTLDLQFGLIFKEKTIGQKELNFWWKTIKKGLHGKREEIIIKEDY